VRAGLFDRDVDSAGVLAGIDVPTLVVHGRQDAVVDPRAAQYAMDKIPGAAGHWLDGVGHLPFLERPEEFDTLVGRLAENGAV
jgi:pimeloyl-ACP methyl ester carboxylesterase